MPHWTDNYKDVKEVFGDNSKPVVKFSIWRSLDKSGHIYPLFVRPEEIKMGDVIFTESRDYDGFAIVTDFVKDAKGKISHWQLQNAGFTLERENHMLKIVEKLIKVAVDSGVKDTVVMVSIKDKD